MENVGTCRIVSKYPPSKETMPLPHTSTGVSSPMRIKGLVLSSMDEND